MKRSKLTDADFEQSGITYERFCKIKYAYLSAGEKAYQQQTSNKPHNNLANFDVKLDTLTSTLRDLLYDAYNRGWKSAQRSESFLDGGTIITPVHPLMNPPGSQAKPLALFP